MSASLAQYADDLDDREAHANIVAYNTLVQDAESELGTSSLIGSQLSAIRQATEPASTLFNNAPNGALSYTFNSDGTIDLTNNNNLSVAANLISAVPPSTESWVTYGQINFANALDYACLQPGGANIQVTLPASTLSSSAAALYSPGAQPNQLSQAQALQGVISAGTFTANSCTISTTDGTTASVTIANGVRSVDLVTPDTQLNVVQTPVLNETPQTLNNLDVQTPAPAIPTQVTASSTSSAQQVESLLGFQSGSFSYNAGTQLNVSDDSGLSLSMTSASINVLSSSALIITGNSDAVAVGVGSSLSYSGSNGTALLGQSTSFTSLGGSGNSFTLDGSSALLSASASTVNLGASNLSDKVVGTGDGLYGGSYTGDSVTLIGSGTATLNSGTVLAGSSATSFTLGGTGDTAADASGVTGGTVTLTGTGDTASLSGGTIDFGASSQTLAITGSSDAVNGGSYTGDVANLSASGDTATLTSGTINLGASGLSDGVAGSNDAVNAGAYTGDTVTDGGTGGVVTLTSGTALAGSSTASFTLSGNSDTAGDASGVTGGTVTLTGTGDTASLSGAGCVALRQASGARALHLARRRGGRDPALAGADVLPARGDRLEEPPAELAPAGRRIAAAQ